MQPSERDGRAIAMFQKWRKPIRSWLQNRKRIPESAIDDLSQEVFVRLLRYSDDIAIENPQGYLFRIASNLANEWRQRFVNRNPHGDVDEDDALESDTDVEGEFWAGLENQAIALAVDHLKPRQRTILLLHVNDGLTYKQIAIHQHLTYRVVLRDLTRAYAQLRIELRPLRKA